MAKLNLRGAKGTGGKKSKARAVTSNKYRRGGKARGGVPYSGGSKGGDNADFNFGARSF